MSATPNSPNSKAGSSSPKGKNSTVQVPQEPSPKGKSPPPAVEIQPKREVSSAAFKAAYEISQVLSCLSKKDQLSAMRMAGVQAGMTVSSAFTAGPTLQAAPEARATASNGRSRKAPPAPKWGKEVKDQQSKIAGLNKAISEKSSKLGAQLPASDPLLQQREQAFRDLQSLKGKRTSS
jgi:hypothetical protein